MFFISSASRERAARFDDIVACTAEVLQDPNVVGGLDQSQLNDLRRLNEKSFPPNIHDGVAEVPPSYRTPQNGVAVLPVTAREMAASDTLSEQYMCTYGPERTLRDGYSWLYGRTVTVSEVLSELGHRGDSPASPLRYSRDLAGLCIAARLSSKESSPSYRLSAPLILNQTSVARFGRQAVGAVQLHELAHLRTCNREGLTSCTLTGRAGSELFSYYGTYLALMGNQPANRYGKGVWRRAEAVEQARHELGDPTQPFAATSQLVRWLIARRLVQNL